jgi:hypothetical protein
MITNDEAYLEGFNDVINKKHKAINPYNKYDKNFDEWHNGAIDKWNELYPPNTIERAIYGIKQLLFKNYKIDANDENIFTDYNDLTKSLIFMNKHNSQEEYDISKILLEKLNII